MIRIFLTSENSFKSPNSRNRYRLPEKHNQSHRTTKETKRDLLKTHQGRKTSRISQKLRRDQTITFICFICSALRGETEGTVDKLSRVKASKSDKVQIGNDGKLKEGKVQVSKVEFGKATVGNLDTSEFFDTSEKLGTNGKGTDAERIF